MGERLPPSLPYGSVYPGNIIAAHKLNGSRLLNCKQLAHVSNIGFHGNRSRGIDSWLGAR